MAFPHLLWYCYLLGLLNTATSAERKNTRTALLIIDVQDCFVEGGSLAVSNGSQIIPVINRVRKEFGDEFDVVVMSKDWHCPDHVSFAASHPGKNVGDVINLTYTLDGHLCSDQDYPTTVPDLVKCPPTGTNKKIQQMVWPVHCVQNVTSGPTSSNIAESLFTTANDVIIYKGNHCQVDSYSAFYDNGRFGETKLKNELTSRGIDTVYIVGLALDYCVYYTAKDAIELGFKTFVVKDACRGVAATTSAQALEDIVAKGGQVVSSNNIFTSAAQPNCVSSVTSHQQLLFIATVYIMAVFI
ncbi:nicotinamidase-like isoform X3 [Physella acuta]|uniref:nicotinamidase-like isoform X2 n=1 Tax=Physella acuta TaxID=109671 RepID=UPI0027DC9F6A|nr:nicotinamidase-like isoform X2 [Physella acuta]XP_059158821.1 nicotinamidase-like isoform X3 [Physella acuta]